MEKARVELHLGAILAADVAGYSRLMGADEEGTLAELEPIGASSGIPPSSATAATSPTQLATASLWNSAVFWTQ